MLTLPGNEWVARVENLERRVKEQAHENERLRIGRLWLALTIVLVLVLLVANSLRSNPAAAQNAKENQRTLRADKFILEDGMGNVRAELSMDKDRPRLVLYDASKNEVVSLGQHSSSKGRGMLHVGAAGGDNGIVLNGARRYLYLYGGLILSFNFPAQRMPASLSVLPATNGQSSRRRIRARFSR
jgi:hypothetical protein